MVRRIAWAPPHRKSGEVVLVSRPVNSFAKSGGRPATGPRDDSLQRGVALVGCRPTAGKVQSMIMKRLLQAGVLVTSLFTASCHHEPTAPALRALLLTDQASYTATLAGTGVLAYLRFTVIAQYVNQGDAPIYLDRCGGSSQPLVGVQPIGDNGVPVGSTDLVAFACGSGAPIAVEVGAVRTDTLILAAPSPLPANVRLFYLASSCGSSMGTCAPWLPESDRVSNIVQVRAAP